MPSPKLKLYKASGKPKQLSKPPTIAGSVPQSAGSSTNTSNELDSENVRQFELELAWCIQTMESSLNSGKLNANQGESKRSQHVKCQNGFVSCYSSGCHENVENIEEFQPVDDKEEASDASVVR